jgi:hypothetical protein
VFSAAYVILPFSDVAPADAIRASLAPFQRGGRGDLPEKWLAFDDESEAFRRAHEAQFIFMDLGTGGMQIGGDREVYWYVDTLRVRDEMRRRGLRRWNVRFADEMDLDAFFDRYASRLERHPVTGRFGRWLNPHGHWDWWDLGGRFHGRIVGDQARRSGRSVARVSSGESPGRRILANIEDRLGEALGQEPLPEVDVLSDGNIELVATLLAEARAGWEHAYPGALVLPPGALSDSLRWFDTWPQLGPADSIAWLGLPPDASWPTVVSAAYARFEGHWAAGVAYHH